MGEGRRGNLGRDGWRLGAVWRGAGRDGRQHGGALWAGTLYVVMETKKGGRSGLFTYPSSFISTRYGKVR